MTTAAVVVDGVSKRYRRYHLRNQSVKSALFRGGRGHYEEFWVLDDVSFEVPRGATFGLVGSNGSGKSTLLKCMARILQPDRGEIRSVGKLSALLELGAGFHPELSGRENVFLNGSVLGLRRKEIEARFDEIVAFAGRQVSEAIDQPIKTYSSGMYVRLGFSIAVNIDPDVLLVDEVLAVGDEEFQRRCLDRFDQLAADGKTVIVVSHALNAVATMCSHAAWLDQGKLQVVGTPQQVIDAYLGKVDFGHAAANDQPGRDGIRITEVGVHRVDGTDLAEGSGEVVGVGEPVVLRIGFETEHAVPTPTIAFTIHTIDGVLVANPTTVGRPVPEKLEGRGTIELTVPQLMLVPGGYQLGAALLDPGGEHAFDKKLRAVRFEVRGLLPGETRGITALGGRWSGPGFGGEDGR